MLSLSGLLEQYAKKKKIMKEKVYFKNQDTCIDLILN